MEKKLALLIDADNVSPKYVDPILNELIRYGTVTYKRIYGDWTSNQKSSWKEELLTHSISPIQQFSYTNGKNATDSAMIIDAMDILYTNQIDGFCIVSSDSDFTRLASRIRESGLMVIGMGEEKTPVPFRKACDIFTNLELLLEDQISSGLQEDLDSIPVVDDTKVKLIQDKPEKALRGKVKNQVLEAVGQAAVSKEQNKKEVKCKEASKIADKAKIEDAVVKIIMENKNKDKKTSLGEVGSRLVKLYPDFDVRTYGYSLLSKFLEEFKKIELNKAGHQVNVMLVENQDTRHQVERYIETRVRQSGKQGVELSELGNMVHRKFKNFKVRDYGYAQFKKFVRQMDELELKEEKDKKKVVVVASSI